MLGWSKYVLLVLNGELIICNMICRHQVQLFPLSKVLQFGNYFIIFLTNVYENQNSLFDNQNSPF